MLKRIIYGSIFAVVCAGLLLVLFLNRFNRITPNEVLEAVPEDAVLFIEDLDYAYLTEHFLRENRIWIDFINTTDRGKTDSLLLRVLEQVNNAAPLKKLLDSEGVNLSLHQVGKDRLIPLFFISFESSHSDNEFEQLMLGLVENRAMVNERKYETETLFDVSGEPAFIQGKFSFTCVGGLCLLSSSAMLVEEAVRTLHAESNLSSDTGLQLVRETAGKYVRANIYINYRKLQELFHPFIRESAWQALDAFSELATWGELDLDIKRDAIILNGMTYADPQKALFLGAFADKSAVRIELHEMMPSGTSYFLHLGIGNRRIFMEKMIDYINESGESEKFAGESQRLKKQYGIDPLEDLMRVLDDEMAWFALEGETQRPGDELVVFETKSGSETTDVVLHWIKQYLQVHAFDMRSMRHVYQLDNQTSYNIYKLPEKYFEGTPAERLFNNYFTVFENYLLFGPSVDVLSRVIYQNVLHKTFGNDPVYKEMSEYLSNRSNVTLFFRPFAYLDYKRTMLNDQAKRQLEATELFLRRIPGIVLQYSNEGRLCYQSIGFRYASQIKEKALTVWESLLDSAAAIKPVLVINHNTSEKEIFVQDASNKIYLLNSTGRILWKQPLEGPILGTIRQVDFYKNGKLQYLFNTQKRIYLIDRNGNSVERYPIALRSDATNSLALFDYDKRRDYRIFIATADRKIYVYDIEGNLVTGWKFGKTESKVTGQIQHFRISDKDYIVFSDQNRSYFLDRRGRERIMMKNRVVLSQQNSLTLDMNIREEKPRWISTDTSGNVIAIYLDGSVTTLLKQDLSEKHFFDMADINSDGVPEFIFTSGNELNVVQQDGTRLFNYRVRDRIMERPDIYKFSASDVKLGITDRTRNRIYLINSDGSLYEGFPLEGYTRFSIGYFAGSDSRFNLIVGSANNFLYNYSIE